MDIPLNAEARCTDGVAGQTTHVVVDPVRRTVTHVVVRLEGFIGPRVMVPVEEITESAPSYVQLRLAKRELEQQPPFEETEYLWPPDWDDEIPGPFFYGYPPEGMAMWPYLPASTIVTETHEALPPGELSLRRGDHVDAADGRVGRVDELLVDPATYGITHLVLREGHLWGQKDVTIPVSQIDSIAEGAVRLKLTKHEIGLLPAVPLHRRAGVVDGQDTAA